MADESDVQQSICEMIGAALYPNGVTSNTQLSTLGYEAVIYRGWPNSGALNKDLIAHKMHVTVFAPPNLERNVTRYGLGWIETVAPVVDLTASVAGAEVTLGGAPTQGVNVAVLVGRKAYVYTVALGDTLSSVATALAALIEANWPGTSSAGPVITIASTLPIKVRLGGVGTAAREVTRQEKQFMVSVWAWTPEVRDAAANLIKPALDSVIRFTLPDNWTAHMRYVRGGENDAPQKESLYRRDFYYAVEFATTQSAQFPQIVAFETALQDPSGVVVSDNFE